MTALGREVASRTVRALPSWRPFPSASSYRTSESRRRASGVAPAAAGSMDGSGIGSSSQVRPSSSRPRALGCATTPLLVEVGHARLTQRSRNARTQSRVYRTMARTAFPACDDPVNAGQIEIIERAKQRLGADKSHRGRDPAQIIGAPYPPPVLDGDPRPRRDPAKGAAAPAVRDGHCAS